MLEVMEKGFDWLFACGSFEGHAYAFNNWFDGSPFALGFCAFTLGCVVAVCVSKKLRKMFFQWGAEMLLMTLGIVFFFIGVFKNDKRFFKAILGCVLFDVVFWILYFGELFLFPKIVERLAG